MSHNSKEQLEIINQQIKDLIGIYRSAVSRYGISENEFWIWYALIIMDGEYSQQEICDMWSFSKQTVNTIVSTMVRNAYISLEVIPGTRNKKMIRLTEAGRKYGESIVLPIFDAEERALERLPVEEQQACFSIFSKYIEFLKVEMPKNETENS